MDTTSEILRLQLNDARAAWNRERSQKTVDQFSTALKRFNEFLCSGVVPHDLDRSRRGKGWLVTR